MIKTLIVDDEIWVCQLIKNIIDWNSYGFSIIDEAYNGNDAIYKIIEKKPDLVLTDIRMPGIDGIGIIEKINQMGLETKFVIISGYNDFGYAKKGIKYGALGYLLKPIDKDELIEYLIMINKNIIQDRENEKKNEELKENLETSLVHLRDQFFNNYFTNVMHSSKIDINTINKEFKSSFKKGLFKTIVYKFDLDAKSNYDMIELLRQRTYQYAKELFAPMCFECVMVFINNAAVVIVNYCDENKSHIQKLVEELFKKIINNNIKISDFDLTVGIGSEENDISQLRKSYETAMDGIAARIKLGLNRIIDLTKYQIVNYSVSQAFNMENEKKLISYFDVFDNVSARELIKEVFHNIENKDIDPKLIFLVSKELLDTFYKTMKRKSGNDENAYGNYADIYKQIENSKRIEDILNCFEKLIDSAKNYFNSINSSQNAKPVEVIKTYISNHYKEDINLKDISEIVYLNPKYLGELFKKETGISYSDYIINYRMDIAKDLLKDIRYRINEISEMVGYRDPKHFSKIFKKYVGVTPMQYKKMFG